MKCPNDQSNLVLKSKEGVVGFTCNQCQSVFLKTKDVDAFKYNFETGCLEKVFKSTKIHLTEKKCANCDSSMYRADIASMPIDICKECTSVLFQQGQITQIKEEHSEVSDFDVGLMGCLPPSLVALFLLFKYFSVSPDSKHKAFYGWMFIIAVFFVILFWGNYSSYQCGG